jgi:copper(I)-binding protein
MKEISMQKTNAFAAAAAAFFALAAPMAQAGDITVTDAYLRVSGAMAQSAAAFMVIENAGAEDRLVSATSDLAKKVELHTHEQDAAGVMKMIHVEEGFVIPENGEHGLVRGADHVMFLGLNSVPVQGDKVTVTLTFEKAGDVVVEVPVDNERAAAAMKHGDMGNGKMDHGTMAPKN